MSINSSAKFEIFQGADRQYYFRLKAPNGEIIGWSEGYTQKASAKNGISSVRINSQVLDNFTVWQSTNDNQYYFNLKAPNGEIILRSEGYTSRTNANKGVAAVKLYSPGAVLVDLTLRSYS